MVNELHRPSPTPSAEKTGGNIRRENPRAIGVSSCPFCLRLLNGDGCNVVGVIVVVIVAWLALWSFGSNVGGGGGGRREAVVESDVGGGDLVVVGRWRRSWLW